VSYLPVYVDGLRTVNAVGINIAGARYLGDEQISLPGFAASSEHKAPRVHNEFDGSL
jgi:hypothetical protein